jgi:hypothetical protein
MSRSLRVVALLLAVLVAGAAFAEARGGGGRMGGGGGGAGMKRGKRSTRASAQVESLIQESFRRDALQRLRHADW